MLIAVLIITFISLLLSVLWGIFLGYPLILSAALFSALAYKKGYSIKEIVNMGMSGVKKSLIVVPTFLMIGMLTSSWLQAGTIPTLVAYGIRFIHPNMFVLISFLLCAVISMLLGSSFGSTSTMGVVLITIARSSGVSLPLVAGAIISGVYVGDRSSPMSTSLALTCAITDMPFYDGVKKSIKSSIAPFFISSAILLALSVMNPLTTISSELISELYLEFIIGIISLLPAVIIIVMCLLKINMRICILVSSTCACAVSVLIQGEAVFDVIRTLFMGFYLPETSPINTLIRGGGMISMLSAAVIVLISCCIAGVFDEGKFIEDIKITTNTTSKSKRFVMSAVYALASSAIFCNQTAATIMSAELMRDDYKCENIKSDELFLDLNTVGCFLPATIPWNVAIYVPMQALGMSGISYVPFLVYIYVLVIYRFFVYARKKS